MGTVPWGQSPGDCPQGTVPIRGYDGGMICGVLLTVLMGTQPVCTQKMFSKSIEPNLRGDTKVVARAVFDEYLESVSTIDTAPVERQTPLEFVEAQRANEELADALFDSFLDSLAVLSDDVTWSDALKQVRRRVLLNAREANNPWPNTQWYDVASNVQTSPQFINEVDLFLLQHVDADRQNRFAALIAIHKGDKEGCQDAERETMQRWAIYNKLIAPYENDLSLTQSYPAIPTVGEVERIYFKIVESIENTAQIEAVTNLFNVYHAMHTQQMRTTIALVNRTRINDGVDPLSSGCGTPDTSRNIILQKTAEMHEFDAATMQSMMQVLTPEQRQELEFVE